MLKTFLATLDGLDAKYHPLYTKQEDGTYKLDDSIIPSNVEDVSGLKNTNVALKQEKIELQEKLEAIKLKEAEAEEKGMLDNKQFEELTARKDATHADALKGETAKTLKAITALKDSMINSAVNSLASSLAGDSAELLKPHLKGRFQVNEVGDDYVLQITDVNGSVSQLTAAQLGDEFKANKLYAPLLKGRQSSGGGSGGGAGGGKGTDDYSKYFDPKSPDYNSEKQYELEQKDKPAHDALVKKFNLDDPFHQ